ncbi:hypothetical protein AB0L96_03710, partial [Streptomyces sp. NPDC052115]
MPGGRGTTGNRGTVGSRGAPGGPGDLLHLVRSGRATTRGALQQATGLSRATVGQRLDRLFRAGWLREGAGDPVASPLGGRPALRLEFDDAHAVVLAADLETRHARTALLTLGGEIIAERSGPLTIEDGPDAVLGELGARFGALLRESGHRAASVCGIGLAVPGPVDSETGRVVQPPIMPGWDGYDIRARLRRALAEESRGRAGTGPAGTGQAATGPDGARADGARADGARADGARADGTRADGTRADGTRADGTRADGTRADGTRADGARA